MLLECRGLQVTIGARTLLHDLNLRVDAGNILAVLGQNGAGKTLTLHTLAGIRSPAAGDILFRERRLADWRRRELAAQLALLPQTIEDPFPATVLETVLLGRHPHIPRWRWESTDDVSVARNAIGAVGLAGYEQRDILTLSGGERRRAALAAILAQAPTVFLLDEPVNHLDPSHQLAALKIMRERADAGAAVIVTLHDANLAMRFADQVLLLEGGGAWRFGSAADTLTAENLSALYATRFASIQDGERRIFFQR